MMVEGVADLRQLGRQPRVSRQGLRHLLHTVDDRGVIAMPKEKTNVLEGELSIFPQQVHRCVTSFRYGPRSTLARERLQRDVEV